MGPHARNRPGNCGMLGGKRAAAGKEGSVLRTLIRALPLEGRLEKVSHRRAIYGGFGAEQPGFRQVVVALYPAQQVGTGCQTGQRVDGIVRSILAAVYDAGRYLFLDPTVGSYDRSHQSHRRSSPLQILPMEPAGQRPELLLAAPE